MQVRKILVGFVLTVMMVGAFAQTICNAPAGSKGPEVKGCWELMLLNVLWEPSNPIMKGLDGRAVDGLDRQQRMRDLGPQLWHAQHAGKVEQAGDNYFYVMMYATNPAITDGQVTGFMMNKAKTQVVRTVPENVTGKIEPPKSELGLPDRVYRIKAEGISTSLHFPRELVVRGKTAIIVCLVGRHGVYPNKITLNQGHFVGPKTLASLWDDGSTRGLMPFISTQ